MLFHPEVRNEWVVVNFLKWSEEIYSSSQRWERSSLAEMIYPGISEIIERSIQWWQKGQKPFRSAFISKTSSEFNARLSTTTHFSWGRFVRTAGLNWWWHFWQNAHNPYWMMILWRPFSLMDRITGWLIEYFRYLSFVALLVTPVFLIEIEDYHGKKVSGFYWMMIHDRRGIELAYFCWPGRPGRDHNHRWWEISTDPEWLGLLVLDERKPDIPWLFGKHRSRG